jgi:broad specificity phosphatase PhoE
MNRSIYVNLIRHGPTLWTAEGRLQGQSDVPLSPAGEAVVARWRLPLDLLRLQTAGELSWAASPLRRAVETALRLGANALVLEPRLMEAHTGEWTGLRMEEVKALEGTGWDWRPPGGESPRDVFSRAQAWLDEVAARDGPETWIAVTHQGVIRVLLAAAVGWNLQASAPFRLLPERVHRLRRRGDGHLQLLTLNEPLISL